jgi:hypothetical protein
VLHFHKNPQTTEVTVFSEKALPGSLLQACVVATSHWGNDAAQPSDFKAGVNCSKITEKLQLLCRTFKNGFGILRCALKIIRQLG